MELLSNLAPRGKRGNYQLRLVVPPYLRPIIGRREFTKSLGTSDRRDAARQAVPILAEWNSIIDEAHRVARNFDSGGIAFEVGFEKLLARLEQTRRSVPAGVDAFQAYTKLRHTELLNLVRRRRDGQLEVWEGIADRTIANLGMPIVKGSDEYSSFVNEIADFVIEAVSLDNRRNTGELHAEPRSEIVRQRVRRKDEQAAAGETTMELFEKYGAQRLHVKRKRAASIDKDRKIVGSLADFVGADRAVKSIVKKDVRDWIDARAGPAFEIFEQRCDGSTELGEAGIVQRLPFRSQPYAFGQEVIAEQPHSLPRRRTGIQGQACSNLSPGAGCTCRRRHGTPARGWSICGLTGNLASKR